MTEIPVRYYAYMKRGIRGPFLPKDLVSLSGFERSTLICPEKALGQWVEASLNPDFQTLIETPPPPPVKPKPPQTAEAAEDLASKVLLEKAIAKNAALEKEVRELRKAYTAEKNHFDASLKRRETEARALTDKLKRNVEAVQTVKGEHPSWEMLYKTLKKRSEEKLAELTQALAEKGTEIARLKENGYDQAEALRQASARADAAIAETEALAKSELRELREELEEKELVARTLSENVTSLLGKNEELQHIMLDERRDAEEQIQKYCEEIGRMRTEMKWREQEIAKIREELTDAMHKVREFEAVEDIKSREQEELYGVISNKLRILSGYFENLEARVKFAFRKA